MSSDLRRCNPDMQRQQPGAAASLATVATTATTVATVAAVAPRAATGAMHQ